MCVCVCVGGGGGSTRGAYAQDTYTSVRLCAKNAGLCARGGGIFVGHYGIYHF